MPKKCLKLLFAWLNFYKISKLKWSQSQPIRLHFFLIVNAFIASDVCVTRGLRSLIFFLNLALIRANYVMPLLAELRNFHTRMQFYKFLYNDLYNIWNAILLQNHLFEIRPAKTMVPVKIIWFVIQNFNTGCFLIESHICAALNALINNEK